MRIAFIVDAFPVLSETFILSQITGLIDLGHEVKIFAGTKPKDNKIHLDVKGYNLLERTYYHNIKPANRLVRIMNALGLLLLNIFRSPLAILRSLNFFKYGRDALALSLFYKTIIFLKAGEFDIVHCHFGRNGTLGVLLWEIGAVGGKVVTSFHGSDISLYVKKHGDDVYAALFKKGDLFLPVSDHWKEELIRLGCDESKIIVHRMGIDTGKLKYSVRKPEDNGKVHLLTIARFIEKKGVKYGIQAVAKALKRHPNLEYKIVGDGLLRDELEDLTGNLKVEDNVELLGWKRQDEVSELMEKSEIFIAPSVTSSEGDQEGIPVVLMEAMATGLPVLSTKHSGIPELVRDGESGFLVPERDVDAMAGRLEYLIEHHEVWPEMGQAGRKFVEENYNVHKLNKCLVEIYQKLLEG